MSLPTPEMRAPAQDCPCLAQLEWQALLSDPMPGPENMACDLALMDRARSTGESVLRVYSWSVPTLSFGRNQKTTGYDAADLARKAIAAVRRPTGGRAILHHREITYSITAPVPTGQSLAAAYSWINELLLAALRSIGVEAKIAARSERAPAPDSNPCFATATPGEITTAGRKLVGSAQYRNDGAMLQHGSILVSDDQSSLAGLGVAGPSVRPATLQESLGRSPAPRELLDALIGALARKGIEPKSLEQDDVTQSAARYVPFFSSPDWTWRR